ncbi:hypothetical protein PMZ80_006527 [Knufia obscura]|uniref:FAD dependent oxidoreductase domain-containing protein n=2 Tax=Knufia TaxID=430999 RepID=A0AAN8I5V0_9EURO|nr:hypothetical protein PMZ80_006527 [Knufia obscura]KAK5950886.1 hypothetical protein OHC33_007957 [Knufia fluminis]
MTDNNNVVILGGGIIGLSIAYHLSHSPSHNQQIHIFDAAERLLESASGYAGGFLARDWFPEQAAALGDFSFELHRQLADKHNGQERWGYAGSHVYSLAPDDAPAGTRGEDWLLAGTSRAQAAGRQAYGHVSAPEEKVNEDGTPAWMTPQSGASWNVVAGVEDCAQVEPRKLCEFLLSEIQRRGVQLHLSTRAIGVTTNANGKISALRLEATNGLTEPTVLSCSDIVLAAGCWTPRVYKTLFPRSRLEVEIDALAGHSVIYRSPRYTKPFLNVASGQEGKAHSKDKHISYAIYCPPTKTWSYSPEAYARLDGDGKPEIWIGGLNNNSTELPLPELATDSKKLVNKERITELRQAAVQLTGLKGQEGTAAEDDLEIVSEALCFRPASKSGVPIITEVPHKDLGLGSHVTAGAKVWIAGGHGPWGISLSLGTGVVMSDMISGREPTVDISALRMQSPIASKL